MRGHYMKYTFTTKANERVIINNSILGGKVKVIIDRKEVGPTNRGARGAAGAYYPIKSGTLEVRTNLFELVPRVWYNEDWVDLVPPLALPQYMMIALPFLGSLFIGQIVGLVVGLLGSGICWLIMHSQRPARTRFILCIIVAILTPLIAFAGAIAITIGLGSPQP